MIEKQSICRQIARTVTAGKNGPYSTKVLLKERFRNTCENEKLVGKGSFTMKKSRASTSSLYHWVFKAILKKGACCKQAVNLSKLMAARVGHAIMSKLIQDHCDAD